MKQMAEEIHAIRHEICTEWELGFIEQIYRLLVTDAMPAFHLSEKQEDQLRRLYEKACESKY